MSNGFIKLIFVLIIGSIIVGGGVYLLEIEDKKAVNGVGGRIDQDLVSLRKNFAERRRTAESKLKSVIQEEQNKFEKNLGIDRLKTADVDPSSWKTYRNEQYWFEVRYPPSFTISAGSNVDWDEWGEVKRVTQIPPYPETPGARKVYIIDDKNHIFSENPAPVEIREYVPFAAESKFANMVEDDLVVQTNLEKILRIGYEPFKNKQVYRVYWKPDTNNIWQLDWILLNHKGKTLNIYYRTDKKIFRDIVDTMTFID